jgi:di/tricarboxylate transporter
MPIVLALAERLGLPPGSNGHTGLVMTVASASYMAPATILPANIPNTVLLGASESLYGIKLTYGPYLLLHFPILGALKTCALVWLVCRIYPEPRPLQLTDDEERPTDPRRQRRLTCVLAASLLLFATDFWHGVSPAWISLGAGILCLMPFMDLVGTKLFSEKMNLTPLIYVAGFLGLGAVVTESGLGRRFSEALLDISHLTPGHPTTNLAILVAIGAGIGALTTLPGLPAVLTPLAADFARASGLPLPSVLMLQVVVFSTVFLPYQAPPMMIAMHLGGVRVRAATKLCLALAAVTVLVLFPLDYLWWRLLGYV